MSVVRTDKIKLLSGLLSGDSGAWQSLKHLQAELPGKQEQQILSWLKAHMGAFTYDELIELLGYSRQTNGKTQEDFDAFISSLQSKYNL